MNKNVLSGLIICCAIVVGFNACKKDNPLAPATPDQTVKPGKAVWFVLPKTGQTLLYGSQSEFRWAVNKDSAVKRVVVGVRECREGAGDYKALFECSADSVSKMMRLNLAPEKRYSFVIHAFNSSNNDTCENVLVSGVAFEIYNPVAGASLSIGSTVDILVGNSTGKKVAFDLSTDNGNNWKEIIPVGGKQTWTVKERPCDAARLRMRTMDTSMIFISDPFKLLQSISYFAITSPKGGDAIDVFSKVTVAYVDISADPFIIDISMDDGASWTQLFDDNNPPKSGTKNWAVTQDPSDSCRLRMRSKVSSLTFVSDRFSISIKNLDRVFSILSPAAGDILSIGSLVAMQTTNTTGLTATLEYSIDNGASWKAPTINNGKWFVNEGPSDYCFLRMRAGSYVTQTGLFKIVTDGLSEFIPLRPGKKFTYKYVHQTWRSPYVNNDEIYYLDVTLSQVSDMGSEIVWTCILDKFDTSHALIASSTGTIHEQKGVLGKLSADFAPFNHFSQFHYLNLSITDITFSELVIIWSQPPSSSETETFSCTIKRGLGLTKMDNAHSTHVQLNSSGSGYSYTLQ